MEILAEHTSTTVINAPIEKINLTQWLFTLTDHEYQACSTAHIAGGSSVTDDGKMISINVEMVGDNLLVQHYHEDISEAGHCRVSSISDSISPLGRATMGITWELKIKKISDEITEFSNHIIVLLTEDLKILLEKAGITDLALVKPEMLKNAAKHNHEETPLFAKDIEKKANEDTWN
ncbi:hypothetical protein EZ456_13005 [Pedobacter psychrodurus]|uniref:Uncharacterized protein n=1 Tax=Pedobacter psychrodurus TaxID=2530456 RepID=A0A4R0Q051_9SPHI|nr:hypothetical protein [Pedobacter psychrodurus]TCD26506.1 hypothetical protein EZ456_13005 [Pedobacter psychrodurus]